MAIPLDQLIRTVRPCDVLMGRGKLIHNHPGNIEYRRVIKNRYEEYKNLPDRRNEIADEVLTCVESLGGRFIRPVDNHGQDLWVRCADSVVRTKVKQALRDMARQEDDTQTIHLDGSPKISSSVNSFAEGKSLVDLQIPKSSPEVPTHPVIGCQNVASIFGGHQSQLQLNPGAQEYSIPVVDLRLRLPTAFRFGPPMPHPTLLQTASVNGLATVLPCLPVPIYSSTQDPDEESTLLLRYLRQEQNQRPGRSSGLTEREMAELMLELQGTGSMNAVERAQYS